MKYLDEALSTFIYDEEQNLNTLKGRQLILRGLDDELVVGFKPWTIFNTD